jgi:hypothetical protein
VHAGISRAVVQTSGGARFNGPSASFLVRHATLAGLPPAWWRPFPGARRCQAHFISAIEALDAALAAPASARP